MVYTRISRYTGSGERMNEFEKEKSHSGGISTEATEYRFRRRSAPIRHRTFIYLFILFLFFFFHLFGSFSNFVVYLTCLCNCFIIFRALSKNDTPLLFFSEGAFFFRILFLQCNADFDLNGIFRLYRCVSLKKGIPVPLYSKKRVRGLYFEKCCRSNVICSFDGQIELDPM